MRCAPGHQDRKGQASSPLEQGSCHHSIEGWVKEHDVLHIDPAAALGAGRSAPIMLLQKRKPCRGKYFPLSHSYCGRAWVCCTLLSLCPQGTLGLFELM